MIRISLLLTILVLVGCSTTPSHVGNIKETANGHEFSIKDTEYGFIVAGHFSEYQFVRNSKSGFSGCMRVINSAASAYVASKGENVNLPKWDEIEIINHGRDIITAIMRVNCRYEYKFQSNKGSFVDELDRLNELHGSGAITTDEYEKAKSKLLKQ